MTTYEEIVKALEENRPKLYKKDYNFFNVGFISNLAKASIMHRCDCQKCAANTERLLVLAIGYPEMIKSGAVGKRQLEETMDDITSHLIKEHGYARSGWFKPLYSLIGLGIGLVLAVLSVYLMASDSEYQRVVFLSVVGVLIVSGYIAGGFKDFKYEKTGKNL